VKNFSLTCPKCNPALGSIEGMLCLRHSVRIDLAPPNRSEVCLEVGSRDPQQVLSVEHFYLDASDFPGCRNAEQAYVRVKYGNQELMALRIETRSFRVTVKVEEVK